MANDKDFRSDTIMMTVSLMIRNIQAIEARLSALEEAVAKITGQETEAHSDKVRGGTCRQARESVQRLADAQEKRLRPRRRSPGI